MVAYVLTHDAGKSYEAPAHLLRPMQIPNNPAEAGLWLQAFERLDRAMVDRIVAALDADPNSSVAAIRAITRELPQQRVGTLAGLAEELHCAVSAAERARVAAESGIECYISSIASYQDLCLKVRERYRVARERLRPSCAGAML